jgi:hypothetical protein
VLLGEVFAPISAAFRLLSVLVSRRPSHPYKSLQARLIDRGIVAEIPKDLPFYISDEYGKRHKGVYVIGLLIWNRGNQPVVHSDFLKSAPLLVRVGQDATIVAARTLAVEDQTVCSSKIIGDQTLSVTFDCLNPDDYLVIPIFVTGNPLADVEITGRIIGQVDPIDHTAEEAKSTFGERFAAFFLLSVLLSALPGFLGGGYLILRNYGIDLLLYNPQSIPRYLMAPFCMGALTISMFMTSRIMQWVERRKNPGGYPLYSDLEPPLLENIKGFFLTAFKGKKLRVSKSLFSWGKTVLMPYKKIRRRTINDWIR